MRLPISLLAAALAATLPTLAHADTGLDAGDLDTAAGLREQALRGNAAYGLVESLTTDVGPRLAGTEADARAVAWARAKFEALGFDKVYLEPVSFPVWHRGHERAEVIGASPQPLAITALGGSVGTGGKALEAEVVAFADLAALKAAPEGSLAGKIAYVGYRIERHRDGRGYSPGSTIRASGASEAARKGAAALLIRSVGTDSDRLPHTGVMRYAADVTPIPAAALSNPDADQVERLLRRGQPLKLRLDIDAGMRGEFTSHNVIGEIRGRELPQDVVTIGGHLDSWDLGTGAIDDASGVGITMAAGALIGELKKAPRRTVRVIAYANEEQGLYGGKAYAAARAAAGEVPAHQIGAESDFGAGRIYALRAGVDPAAWPVIEKIGEVLAPLGIEVQPGLGSAGPDVGPIVALGAPWAQLAQDGSDYFDYHHTANDTLDKVDPKALDQQVAAYAVLAYLAAETEVDFGQLPVKPATP
jgi:carboxypeptidase Q